jgi:hypothetical protein
VLILVGLKSFGMKEIRKFAEVLILVGLKCFGMKDIPDFVEVLILVGLGRSEAVAGPSTPVGRSGLASLAGCSIRDSAEVLALKGFTAKRATT